MKITVIGFCRLFEFAVYFRLVYYNAEIYFRSVYYNAEIYFRIVYYHAEIVSIRNSDQKVISIRFECWHVLLEP